MKAELKVKVRAAVSNMVFKLTVNYIRQSQRMRPMMPTV